MCISRERAERTPWERVESSGLSLGVGAVVWSQFGLVALAGMEGGPFHGSWYFGIRSLATVIRMGNGNWQGRDAYIPVCSLWPCSEFEYIFL